ncbi:hypothetical protein LIER_07581 [Lithospermum erythrorhizon]|uniref:Uncharacterized protein n=1 Tax=Lithospermum erythrorhizon TaxID=34254 RepID=A0AAV3PAN9_LITER
MAGDETAHRPLSLVDGRAFPPERGDPQNPTAATPIHSNSQTNNVAPPCMVPISGNPQGHKLFPPAFHVQPPPQKSSDVLAQPLQPPSAKTLNPPPKPHDNSLPQTLASAHNATTLALAQHKNHPPSLASPAPAHATIPAQPPAQATAYATPTVQLPAQAPGNAILIAQLPAQVPAIAQTLPPASLELAPAHKPAYAHAPQLQLISPLSQAPPPLASDPPLRILALPLPPHISLLTALPPTYTRPNLHLHVRQAIISIFKRNLLPCISLVTLMLYLDLLPTQRCVQYLSL